MSKMHFRPVHTDKFIGLVGEGEAAAERRRKRSELRRLVTKPSMSLPSLPKATHPLYSAILKLHMADDELKNLEREIGRLRDPEFNCVVLEDEPDGAGKLACLRITRPPDPKLAGAIGACARDLRSVLDVAVTGLSKGRRGRPRKPSFPIFVYKRTRRTKTVREGKTGRKKAIPYGDFDRGGKRLIKHLRAEYQTIIARAQPYHAGRHRWKHPLWLLHELRNVDEHNLVTLTAQTISGASVFNPPAGTTLYVGVPFVDGAIVARFPREVQVPPGLALSIRFDKGCAAVEGEEAMDTLRSMEEQVRHIVGELAFECDK